MNIDEFIIKAKLSNAKFAKGLGKRKNGRYVSASAVSNYRLKMRLPNLEIGKMIEKYTKIVTVEDQLNFFYEVKEE